MKTTRLVSTKTSMPVRFLWLFVLLFLFPTSLLVVIPVVISGNSEDGIRALILSATSIIPVTPTPAPGVNNISSVVCDNSSVISGDVQGINKVSCKVAKL